MHYKFHVTITVHLHQLNNFYTNRCTIKIKFVVAFVNIYIYIFFSYGSTALNGPGPPRFVEVSWSHTLDTPHSVGLLWTSDQPVAETST
jgi:hypothetical protein